MATLVVGQPERSVWNHGPLGELAALIDSADPLPVALRPVGVLALVYCVDHTKRRYATWTEVGEISAHEAKAMLEAALADLEQRIAGVAEG